MSVIEIEMDEDDDLCEANLEEIEKELEGKFLKNGQTAFRILKGGETITPFHSSITNLMNGKGLKLSDTYNLDKHFVEEYTNGKQTFVIHYTQGVFEIEATDKVTGQRLKFDRNMISVYPYMEIFDPVDILKIKNQNDFNPKCIDIRDWIKEYKGNNYLDAITKLADEVARVNRIVRGYIS